MTAQKDLSCKWFRFPVAVRRSEEPPERKKFVTRFLGWSVILNADKRNTRTNKSAASSHRHMSE